MSKMGMTLEIELGITGGEEDGVRRCNSFFVSFKPTHIL